MYCELNPTDAPGYWQHALPLLGVFSAIMFDDFPLPVPGVKEDQVSASHMHSIGLCVLSRSWPQSPPLRRFRRLSQFHCRMYDVATLISNSPYKTNFVNITFSNGNMEFFQVLEGTGSRWHHFLDLVVR